ncbi:MAG: hypothetical protein COV72_05245 [Candidatus Omnitrophica bacterium CG11_big_fil_rev_8_21_14_0_20_42_13]|uniref:Uncharacterized protein n=1 Tax=Candidatus Ghiorseimicrobium undicola TaxID=1974746 RepID=A0A2H0LXB7_9BACT|nr:MAG: hypothetical protein COV72_05245 [Candidatus Omnitrophica bacterium CG11_big_fil_rev_8_21_14_0_20_42_13]
MGLKKITKLSEINRLQKKCSRIHNKIVNLQSRMARIEAKSKDNLAWRSLLVSAVCDMDTALDNFEERLNHIRQEVKEFK